MLIVCAGPDSYRAKAKIRGFAVSFNEKYDKTGKSIESINSSEPYSEIVSKLSSPSLFSSKSMVLCSGLMDGLKVSHIKTLAKALLVDADQTIVVSYEAKKPTQKTIDYFTEKSLLVYAHEELEGAALRKEVQLMCDKYQVDLKVAERLINEFGHDLWAVDSFLQILSANGDAMDFSGKDESTVFQITESIMKSDPLWMKNASTLDKDDVLNVLISQYRSWHMVQSGVADGVHPYVQKKMSMTRIVDPMEKTISAIRALYAARNSISNEYDADALIF